MTSIAIIMIRLSLTIFIIIIIDSGGFIIMLNTTFFCDKQIHSHILMAVVEIDHDRCSLSWVGIVYRSTCSQTFNVATQTIALQGLLVVKSSGGAVLFGHDFEIQPRDS